VGGTITWFSPLTTFTGLVVLTQLVVAGSEFACGIKSAALTGQARRKVFVLVR
jgi:hypothetical protein